MKPTTSGGLGTFKGMQGPDNADRDHLCELTAMPDLMPNAKLDNGYSSVNSKKQMI